LKSLQTEHVTVLSQTSKKLQRLINTAPWTTRQERIALVEPIPTPHKAEGP
jgi:hypothetical protein